METPREATCSARGRQAGNSVFDGALTSLEAVYEVLGRNWWFHHGGGVSTFAGGANVIGTDMVPSGLFVSSFLSLFAPPPPLSPSRKCRVINGQTTINSREASKT